MSKLSNIWNMDVSMPLSYAVTRGFALLVVVLLIGSVYGFGHGYAAADKPLYQAEHNDVVRFRGLDGEVYQIQQIEAVLGGVESWQLLPGNAQYVEPEGSYMKYRWGQVWGRN